MEIVKGDIVVRLSHGRDIYFKVESVDNLTQTAMLRGVDIRLCADAPLSDLVKPGFSEIANYKAKSIKLRAEIVSRAGRKTRASGKELKRSAYVEIPGRVLHLDGDADYMEICRKAYYELQIENTSLFLPEVQQPVQVETLLKQYKPDILVVTGHDGMTKRDSGKDGQENYHNTRYFIEAVQRARSYQPSKDDLVIFAGACQSWYQGLLAAGANYASSPERILIHCLDPVMVVQKVAYTPLNRTANIQDILAQSFTGPAGVGGIETRGQFRLGLPRVNN